MNALGRQLEWQLKIDSEDCLWESSRSHYQNQGTRSRGFIHREEAVETVNGAPCAMIQLAKLLGSRRIQRI